MSLQDESFPYDELLDEKNATMTSTGNFRRQFSVYESIDSGSNMSPFLNPDCSQKTCDSDPVGLEHDHETVDENSTVQNDHLGQTNRQLGSGRSSKAVSYQDIHSEYTKRRYKHVTSKVRKYISDINKQDPDRCNSSATFQRHRSMPESLTPRTTSQEQGQQESFDSPDTEVKRLQSYTEHLEAKIFKKTHDNLVLRQNFETVRNELMDCKEKLARLTNRASADSEPMYSLTYHNQSASEGVSTATQTDLSFVTAHIPQLRNLSNIPAILENTTAQDPHININDITYDSSAGSIEIPLLSVPPAVRQVNFRMVNNSSSIKPLALNFSNDSNEIEVTGNGIAGSCSGSNLQPSSTNRGGTNNSGSSHPSSNDSAIEIEGHDRHSLQPPIRGQTINVTNWKRREGMIYFDKQSNRIVELVALNQRTPLAITDISGSSMFSQSQDTMHFTSTVNRVNRRKLSFTSRMFRIFAPCTSCVNPNQSLETTDATYTVGIPLLADDSNHSRNNR